MGYAMQAIIEKSNFMYIGSRKGVHLVDRPGFSKIHRLEHPAPICTEPNRIAYDSVAAYPANFPWKGCRQVFLRNPFPFFALIVCDIHFKIAALRISHGDTMILI